MSPWHSGMCWLCGKKCAIVIYRNDPKKEYWCMNASHVAQHRGERRALQADLGHFHAAERRVIKMLGDKQ